MLIKVVFTSTAHITTSPTLTTWTSIELAITSTFYLSTFPAGISYTTLTIITCTLGMTVIAKIHILMLEGLNSCQPWTTLVMMPFIQANPIIIYWICLTQNIHGEICFPLVSSYIGEFLAKLRHVLRMFTIHF